MDAYEVAGEEQGVGVSEASSVLTREEIANLAAEGGNSAETLMNVVALIAKRFDANVCSIYLLEPDRANLVLAATVGLNKKCVGVLRMGIYEGLAGLVAEQVRPVSVERAKDHPRFKYFHDAGEDDYQYDDRIGSLTHRDRKPRREQKQKNEGTLELR